MPMGGQAGSEVTLTISGDYLEDVEALHFSDPKISATPAKDDAGQLIANRFEVRIAPETAAGIYEARVMTRLGVSTSRAFSVGTLPEVVREQANNSLETALPLQVNSVCNAVMSVRAIDHYRLELKQGQRIGVDCCASGIDSKLKPVLIVADENGRDLVVQRRGNPAIFAAPKDGSYFVKVHDLTFQGGPYYFYRLVVRAIPDDRALQPLARTRSVNSASWPPVGVQDRGLESIVDGTAPGKRTVELPCDVVGSFYPAANVDTYEFNAKRGEQWWVEVASERLGLPTDPFVLVQHVANVDGAEVLTDVAELGDIASPVKPSSNAYAYDGPPYNAGSSDILGSVQIQTDGLHRLQIRDLFGGTRNSPENIYRLIIRKAAPDFSLVAWGLHMELRNGDRNALSKPISLRGGSTMALEVVAIRRDGFNGPIALSMSNLPEGITATGLTIPSAQSRGIMLLTAAEDAPRGLTSANFVGSAEVAGQLIERPCHLASMAWPVPDAWQEIPSPRLLADVPVSVSGSELAPLSIESAETKVWEVTEGQSLTMPLKLTRRSEFSGSTTQLKTFGSGFDRAPQFTLPLDKDAAEAVFDLAKLKTPPGEYTIAFYGSAVAKYAHNPGAVLIAEAAIAALQKRASAAATEVQRLTDVAATASTDAKAEADQAVKTANEKHQRLLAEVAEANKRVQSLSNAAKPKDIVDIIVSKPITIRVKPMGTQ
jgi:hypothetical protein